jgi:hypothetical protein
VAASQRGHAANSLWVRRGSPAGGTLPSCASVAPRRAGQPRPRGARRAKRVALRTWRTSQRTAQRPQNSPPPRGKAGCAGQTKLGNTFSVAHVWESVVAEIQEVNIKLDDSFAGPVCDFSVGFIKAADDGQLSIPVGTGTFAQLGKTYGIVTASHVLKELQKGTVGLVRFPSVEPPLQNYKLDLGLTQRVDLWSGKDTEAPDIAFLKIPELDAINLKAKGSVFYNLGRERNFVASNPDHHMAKAYAVVGVVGEWTEVGPAMQAKGKKLIVGGLFGAAKSTKEFSLRKVKRTLSRSQLTMPRDRRCRRAMAVSAAARCGNCT